MLARRSIVFAVVAILVATDSVTELLDPRDRPFGSFNKKGFRLYFDSIEKVMFKKAVESCLYRKLELLAIDTVEEVNLPYFSPNFREGDSLHFNDSAMQGLVYWTAMTRSGCPYHFENCLHNVSESFSLNINGMHKGGSCVAVSVRDPSTAARLNNVGLAAKVSICSSKLLLGCEGPEKTFEVREEESSNCKLPQCTGLPACVMDKLRQRQYLTITAPQRFGFWVTECQHNMIELQNELGTWDEAYKRCCSLGMDLVAIQNPNRQNCMEKPNDNSFRFYSGQFWTSGRDIESCRGQLRWCTGYLNDYLKNNLFWKKGTNVQSANNSCVYIDYDDPQVPSLGLADCSEKKKILCEGPSNLAFRSTVFFPFCRDMFRVKKSEAKKLLETGDFSRAGYASKLMIQCIAEYLGLIYNSTEINERVYLSMMAKMSFPIDLDTVNKEIAEKKDWLKTFEKEQGPRKIFNFILDVTYDAMDEFYSSHFQLAAEMISKLYDCRDIAKTNKETFAFDFLWCLLQSKGLNRFWNAYNVEMDPYTLMPIGMEFDTSCLTFGGRLLNSSFCIPRSFQNSFT
ncbi:Hypothetical predicted protein [Cloeon dipterum]|uniref:C-type lectin domain-containing protein n=1 Tax=Cloeon dipterum TaxID=197152 RepID=A0A8S1E628_9INSE|nr:Hypothetical predicted protein [Cloeon dipterum]